MPDKPSSKITWYQAPPGEELLVLRGVGPKVAEAMVNEGIGYLDDLLALDELGIEGLAAHLKGVPADLVRAWVEQARQFKGG